MIVPSSQSFDLADGKPGHKVGEGRKARGIPTKSTVGRHRKWRSYLEKWGYSGHFIFANFSPEKDLRSWPLGGKNRV